MSANDRIRITALLIVLLLIPGAALSAGYRTEQAETGTFSVLLTSNARLIPQDTVEIRLPQEAAQVRSLVSAGSVVKAGDPLMTYRLPSDPSELLGKELELQRLREEREYVASVGQERIESCRSLAESSEGPDRERFTLLARREELLLEEDLRSAEEKVAEAERACAVLEDRGGEKSLLSPFDGTVTDVAQIIGGKVLAGAAVRLVRWDTALIRLDDPEGRLRCGMNVQVLLSDFREQKQTVGTVVSSDEVLPAARRTGSVWIRVDGSVLTHEWQNVTVTREVCRVGNVTIVPNETISASGGLFCVRILGEDGTIRTRRVRKGLSGVFETWILSGAEEGSDLITN